MTIKEIARLAGVSVATVSYALNGTGSVSEEVRGRIRKIAEENGYRKNNMARGLRTGGSNTIGVLAEDVTVWLTPEVIHGLSDYAEQRKKSLLLANLSLGSKIGGRWEQIEEVQEDLTRGLDLLLGAQVEGIVYIGMHDRDMTGVLRPLQKPVCLVGCYGQEFPYVSYDNIGAAREIARYFARRGHRRMGVIGGPLNSKVTRRRLAGFRQGLEEAGLTLLQREFLSGDWGFESGVRLAEELLGQKQRPTALFAMSDPMAAGALAAARKLGIEVPGQLEVFGFDDQQLSVYTAPALSTARVPLYEMGFQAAQRLYDLLEGCADAGSRESLSCPLIFRETTKH